MPIKSQPGVSPLRRGKLQKYFAEIYNFLILENYFCNFTQKLDFVKFQIFPVVLNLSIVQILTCCNIWKLNLVSGQTNKF